MSEPELPRGVAVRILEREYQVACPPEERDHLLDSAAYLNARMKEIRDGGKVSGADRIAVMAALNIAHELIQLQQQNRLLSAGLSERLSAMHEKIDATLGGE